MDGAIADRFKIPGVGEGTPARTAEPGSQAVQVKTRLKLRKPDTPSVSLEPIAPDANGDV